MKKKLTKELLDKICSDPAFPHQVDRNMVQKLAEYGHTDEYMSAFFSVPLSTWEAWKRMYPEFYEALQFWKRFADEEVERALFERARGYDVMEEKVFCSKAGGIIRTEVNTHYPPDVKAISKWLNNRQSDKWKDRQVVEVQTEKDLADMVIKARKRLRDADKESEPEEEDIF